MNGKVLIARDDFLSHHGTDGMRWGVRNGPPYPLNKQGRLALRKQLKQKRKEEKIQKKEEARKRAIEEKEAKLKTEKDRIIKSGTATEALKYKGMWTNQELRNILDRLDSERKLSEASRKEIKTGLDKIEDVSKAVGRLANAGENYVKAYDLVAKIYNATRKEDSDSKYLLPVINGKQKNNDLDKLASEFVKKLSKTTDLNKIGKELDKEKKKG